MTGLASVKQKIRNLAEIVKTNLALELEGKPLRTVSLNRLFLGICHHYSYIFLLYLTICETAPACMHRLLQSAVASARASFGFSIVVRQVDCSVEVLKQSSL
jgi:hypothetical protein